MKEGKPNILVVLLDTCRADRLSCYGYPARTSPNIDSFASKGLLFENAIASAPWTLPSHASLFTGLFPFQHQADEETLRLNEDVPTFAQLLDVSGYHTFAYSPENWWLNPSTNLTKGFSIARGPVRRTPPKNWFLRKISWRLNRFKRHLRPFSVEGIQILIRQLERAGSEGKPFLGFINLMDAHLPYCPDKKFLREFGLHRSDPAMIAFLQQKFKTFISRPEILSSEQMETLRRLYDAAIATLDHRLRILFEAVSAPRFLENTVVVITADHGEALGEHNLLNHWLSLYDFLIRVPLIICGPDHIVPRLRISRQVQQQDLFYTILQTAGIDHELYKAETIAAHSLISQALGQSPLPEHTFSEHAAPKMNLEHIRRYNPDFSDPILEQPKQAVRTNDWKYIRIGNVKEELFNLRSDPGETRDVISENPELASELSRVLKEHLGQAVRTEKSRQAELDPLVAKKLRELGYL